MQLGNIINVGLGLAFTFFLLALIASSIQEFLAGFFSWRGTYLAKALDTILSNDANASFKFYGKFFGLVDRLRVYFSFLPGRAPPGNGPSNPRLDTLIVDVRRHPLMRDVPSKLPAYISGKTFAAALLSALRGNPPNAVNVQAGASQLLAQAQATIDDLPDGDLKTTLSTFLLNAEGDIEKFRASIETWFDGAMDRLSGIYKRHAQVFQFIIGLILAVRFNVDTVHMASVLWSADPSTMNSIIASAVQVKAIDSNDATLAVSHYLKILQSQNLPILWNHDFSFREAFAASTLHAHAIGWLITAVAVTLGAPFWFGLIQNLVNLRSAGPKPGSTTSATTK